MSTPLKGSELRNWVVKESAILTAV